MSDTPKTGALLESILRRDRFLSDKNAPEEWVVHARQVERELAAAKMRVEQLESWKAQALAVEREWDPNAIATMLGGELGQSQRKVIMEKVPKLLAKVQRLVQAGDDLYQLCDASEINFHLVDQIQARCEAWTAAKEEKAG